MRLNAAGIEAEQADGGRRLLPLLHAPFSGGGVIGAVVAGWLLAGDPALRIGYPAVALVAAAMLLSVVTGAARPARQSDERSPAAAPADPVSPASGMRADSLYRQPVLLVLASLAALGFLGEGAMETWSAIYLRGTLEVTPLLGAAGGRRLPRRDAGRSAGDRHRQPRPRAALDARPGRSPRWPCSGALASDAAGLAIGGFAAGLAIGGFLLVGIALSAVAPLAFSLAGDASGGRAGQASALITTIGYAGFLLGPALIGGLAELLSLRLALGVVVVVGVLIALLAGRAAPTGAGAT